MTPHIPIWDRTRAIEVLTPEDPWATDAPGADVPPAPIACPRCNDTGETWDGRTVEHDTGQPVTHPCTCNPKDHR